MRITPNRKRGRRYWARFLSIYALASLAAFYLVVPLGLTYLLAHPRRYPVCCITPADFGWGYETVEFLSTDGVRLSGWYIPSQNGAAVIAVHANSGNRTGMLYHADVLADSGYGVLLFDVRGFGESEGSVVPYPEGGLAEDVLGAVRYLQGRPDVDPSRIGALGLSMGGLIVLRAAAIERGIRAVMADGAGETSQEDLAGQMPALLYRVYVGPIYILLLRLIGVTTPAPGPMISDVIADISPRPVFLVASGTGEELEDNRAFYQLAGEPRLLWELPQAAHIGGIFSSSSEYHRMMVEFFDQALLE